MVRALLIAGVLLFAAPIISRCQLVTSNAFVEADVANDGFGLVTISFANTGHGSSLTHAGTSFLTVWVNGTSYFTNNPNIPLSGSDPPFPGPATEYLKDGRTFKIGDTIRTDWQPQGPNTFDIIQDVYPVAFPIAGSGQIVIRFSIVNHQAGFLSVRPQYLLDMGLSDRTFVNDSFNDNPPVTTRFGYMSTQWTSFPNPANGDGIPPYFIATLLPMSNEHFPDEIGEGYCNDSLAPEPMGLMQPSLLAFVQWPEIVTNWTWGFPTTMPSPETPNIDDNALLFQWPGGGANQGDTSVIGSFSYGSASCTPIAFGNLDAMLIHPDHIRWSGPPTNTYVPNRFPVDAIVWNASEINATNAFGTQSIANVATGVQDGPVTIASPQPTTNNGFMQKHGMTGDSLQTIHAGTIGTISWEDTVLASVLTNCETDSEYNISFTLSADAGVNTTFLTPCVCPIVVDCEEKSNIVPQTTVLNRSGSYDGSECNTRCTEVVAFDTGAVRIPVLSVQSDTLTNMTLSIAPNHAGADSTFYTVCVIDSMQNGHAAITITDSLGNSSIEDYEYCTIADTHAPIITLKAKYDTAAGPLFDISDDQPWDRGLDTIIVTNLVNLRIDASSPSDLNVQGLPTSWISLVSTGDTPQSLCIQATDLAGNTMDTCFSFAASGVAVATQEQISLNVSQNPAADDAIISIIGAPSADVEIFDVLGREVASFRVDGTYGWETEGLPSGIYFVRAQIGTSIVIKKLIQ